MRRVLLNFLAGAIGGFVIWMLTEPFRWLHADRPAGYDLNYTAILTLGALLGAGIGAALGAAEGWDRGSLRQTWTFALGGAGTGLVGGLIGIFVGQQIYGPWEVFNERLTAPNPANPLNVALLPLAFLSQVAARTTGWALIGLFVGASMGLLRLQPRRIKSGLVGGLIGGAVGGFCFEIVNHISGVPALSRAIGFTCVGAGTGLGVSLAQQIARQAWVRVLVGRNEGRDYLLEKEVNTLGRDEMSDVPLFGDPEVGKVHAYIRRVSGVWFVQDAGNSTGTQVNGHPVREQALQEGDRITIGRFQLEFHHKGPAPVLVRDAAPAPVAPAQTVPSGVCAFCGTAKNPITGACACTPAGSPAAVPAGAPAAMAMAWPSGGGAGTSAAAAGSSSGRIGLVATTGPYAGQRYTVTGQASIGRQEGNTLALPADPAVSRRHAVLTAGPRGLLIHDEGSSNGTYVNGARVTDATLRPGDEIQVGETRLRVEATP